MVPRSVVALIAILLLASSVSDAQTPKRGGVLRIGNLGEPPSLDPHWGTQTITEVLANHVFEGLYALDEGYRPIPMLADGMPTVSKDGLTYGIKLRKGVKFHNGKEVTSDDVVASLLRWGKRSVYGKSLFAQVADFKATDTYAVEFKLKEKSAIVVISLAVPNNMGAIYPKEIAEKFPPDQRITEWVGTGPFKIAEWKPDQYIRMVRFEDYTRLPGKQSGYGGAKIAYVDELRWIPVPEAASRAAQLESGDLDVADDLVADGYDRLKANANVHPVIVKPYYWLVAVFNKKEGLMTNAKLRQAWQAALDVEPIMKTVAGGKPEFYRMDSSLAFQELPTWHTKIAGLPWNERNRDKARRLLKEAGYTGQPVRFMTTQEYKWMYDFALVSKQQLEEVGFKVDLQVMDWSTLGQRRVQPKEYDVFTTGMGNFFDPTHHIYLTPTWPGWTEDEQIATLMAQLARETELKKRQELWAQMTKLFYEKVPVARYGDLFGLRALRTTVKGFNDKTEQLGAFYVRVLRGDLGRSYFLNRPVTQALWERAEPTSLLTLSALLVAIAIGVPSGLIAGAFPGSAWDRVLMLAALFGVCIPGFWLSLNFIYFFAVRLGWLPAGGYASVFVDPGAALRDMVLPAVSLGFNQSALIARIARSCMLEVLQQDYIRTARAKGLSQGVVIGRHALRNAMVPVVTVIGITTAVLIGGAVVTEIGFHIPGLGRLIISAILRRDYPVVQGVVLVTAAAYVLVNLVVDVLYVVIDPRIRYD